MKRCRKIKGEESVIEVMLIVGIPALFFGILGWIGEIILGTGEDDE